MQTNRPLLRARNPGTVRRCELVRGQSEDTLYVYGMIGESFFEDGITAADFAQAVRGSKAQRLNLRINSPGGDVFEGVAMAQALRDFPGDVVAHVDGLAASAATLLTTAAKRTLMAKGSMLMIHQAWTFAMGNADELISQAALLEKIDGQIAQQYADRAGVTPAQAMEWMSAETWFTETEAVAAKLADGIQNDEPDADDAAKARIRQWDLKAFQNAPAALLKEPELGTTIGSLNVRLKVEVVKDEPRTFHEYERRRRMASLLERAPA